MTNIIQRWNQTALYKRNLLELLLLITAAMYFGWPGALICFLINFAFNIYCWRQTCLNLEQ